MKQIVYLTNKKVWFDGTFFDWKEVGLSKIFRENKKRLTGSDIRIILGNDVSYLCAFPRKGAGEPKREEVLLETRNNFPIPVEDDTFDWSMAIMGKMGWIQTVAVEKSLLEEISRAVKENKLNVNLMIPIGILLGQISLQKKAPVIITWSGLEKISVLAAGGLVDSAFSSYSSDQITTYAMAKWALKTAPEVVMVDDTNFNLNDWAFAEKNKGMDSEVLNIPIFRNLLPVQTVSKLSNAIQSDIVIGNEVKTETLRNKWLLPVLIMGAILMVGILLFFFNVKQKKTDINTPETLTTPFVAPSASPSASINPGNYAVQVLNGSGVTGLAAETRDRLLGEGFTIVDIGNAPDTVDGTIRAKSKVPNEIKVKVIDSLSGYVIGEAETLEENNTYDLMVVIGSLTK